MKQYIFVGNYSGEGINLLEFNPEREIKECCKIGNFINNSYICRYKNYLYGVVETDGDEKVPSGHLVSYLLENNTIELLNATISHGRGPCFLTVDTSRDILYVAHYSSGGSFTAFKLESDGRIGKKLYKQNFSKTSHIHHIQFSKDYKNMYVIDSGQQCLFEYEINLQEETLTFVEKSKFSFPENCNPRHMALDDKNNIYVVTEKSCEIYKLNYDSENHLTVLAKKSILPYGTSLSPNFTGCAIKIDSKMQYIYTSIRGHNSISVFDIREDKLEMIQNISCEGYGPRDISLDISENYLICANQFSDNISIFNVQNGLLSFSSKYNIDIPSCILIEKKEF